MTHMTPTPAAGEPVEREAFEAWAKTTLGGEIARASDNGYEVIATHAAWLAWQARTLPAEAKGKAAMKTAVEIVHKCVMIDDRDDRIAAVAAIIAHAQPGDRYAEGVEDAAKMLDEAAKHGETPEISATLSLAANNARALGAQP